MNCLTYQNWGGWIKISLVLLRCLLFIVYHPSFVFASTGTIIIIKLSDSSIPILSSSRECMLPDPSEMFESSSDEETLVQLWPWKLIFWGRNVLVAQHFQLFSSVSADLEPPVEWTHTKQYFSDKQHTKCRHSWCSFVTLDTLKKVWKI